MMDARSLTKALGGRWYGRYGMARCPAHDDRTPSLKVRNEVIRAETRSHPPLHRRPPLGAATTTRWNTTRTAIQSCRTVCGETKCADCPRGTGDAMRGLDLEPTPALHEMLHERLDAYSRHAGALAEELGSTDAGDAVFQISADLATLGLLVEVLQDRDRFSPLMPRQRKSSARYQPETHRTVQKESLKLWTSWTNSLASFFARLSW